MQADRLAQHAAQVERRPVRERAAHNQELAAVHPRRKIIVLGRIKPPDRPVEPPLPREHAELLERRQRLEIAATEHGQASFPKIMRFQMMDESSKP